MAREQAATEVVARSGAAFVHPYDDPRVVAGQGTAIAVRALWPAARVVGAEPAVVHVCVGTDGRVDGLPVVALSRTGGAVPVGRRGHP